MVKPHGQRTCYFSQQTVMDMQCDLLVSSFNSPKTSTLMKESIRHLSDGSSPHCAGAMKLGFKKAFDAKKRETCVLLQCSSTSCGWSKTPVSYSFVQSNTYCPHCLQSRGRHKRRMLCTGCGHKRKGEYTSCQGCGKIFA